MNLRIIYLFLFTVRLYAFTFKPSAHPTRNPTNICDDPLPCYLNSLEIEIPDICEDLNGKQLCIYDLICEGILINSVDSAYVPPTTLSVAVNGIGTSCSGKYSYGILYTGIVHLDINDTNIAVDMLVSKSLQNELPVALKFSSCDVESMRIDLSFSTTGLDALAPIMEALIREAVQLLICQSFNYYLQTNVTDTLVNVIDPTIEAIIDSIPSTVPEFSADYMRWDDSFVSTIHSLISSIRTHFTEGITLAEFVSCMSSQDSQVVSAFLDVFAGPDSPVKIGENHTLLIDLSSFNLVFPLGSNSTVVLLGLSIDGLDTLNDLSLLEPSATSNATMHTEVSFEYLTMKLDMFFYIDEKFDNKSSIREYAYAEQLTAVFDVSDVTFLLDLLLAVDKYVLSTLFLDQLQHLGCWLYVIDEISIPSLELIMTVREVSVTQQRGDAGLLEKGLVDLVDNALQLLTDGFSEMVSGFINGVFQGPLRSLINGNMRNWIASIKTEESCLTHYPLHASDNFKPWANSTLISLFNSVFNEKLGASGINQIVNCATNYTGVATLLSTSHLLVQVSGLNSFFDLKLLAPDKTGDVNAIYELINSVGIGHCANEDDCKPFKLILSSSTTSNPTDSVEYSSAIRVTKPPSSSATVNAKIAGAVLETFNVIGRNGLLGANISTNLDEVWENYAFDHSLQSVEYFTQKDQLLATNKPNPNIRGGLNRALLEEIELAFSSRRLSSSLQAVSLQGASLEIVLENFLIELNLIAEIDINSMKDLSFGQLGVQGCVPSSFDELSIQMLSLTLSEADIVIHNGDTQFKNLTAGFMKFLSHLGTPEHLNKWNQKIQKSLDSSGTTCNNGGIVPLSNDDLEPSDNGGESSAWQWQMFLLVGGCVASLFCLLWAYQYWGKEKNRIYCLGKIQNGAKIIRRLGSMNDPMESENLPVDQTLWDKWDCKNTLIFHEKVPMWLRVLFPLCIIGNIAIFLDSNIAPNAVSVVVTLIIGDVKKNLGSVFDFGLGNTVTDMWEAKVYTLAILIAFFSGAWPYIKLVLMLASWVFPPGWLSIPTREFILRMVDALGKWSLIDFFVMILMLCAFYYQLEIAPQFTVLVNVVPNWGFYGFLLATMMSLGLGHILLACHRLIVDPKLNNSVAVDDGRESLASHVYHLTVLPEDAKYFFITPSKTDNLLGDSDRPSVAPGEEVISSLSEAHLVIRVTTLGMGMIIFSFLTVLLFLMAGTFLETIQFMFRGLVGVMLKDVAEVDYSFVTIGTTVPISSGTPDDFGVRWLQASFYLFGMAMPIGTLLVLFVLWVVPLNLYYQRLFFVLSEVLNAWSALDVFCISIAASLLEIQQFAMFIVGDSCDGINVLLKTYLDAYLDGDDVCFDVVASMMPDSWVLFTSAALFVLVTLPSLTIGSEVIKSRFHKTYLVNSSEEEVEKEHERAVSIVSPAKVIHDGGRFSLVTNEERKGDLREPLLETFVDEMIFASKESLRESFSSRGSAGVSGNLQNDSVDQEENKGEDDEDVSLRKRTYMEWMGIQSLRLLAFMRVVTVSFDTELEPI